MTDRDLLARARTDPDAFVQLVASGDLPVRLPLLHRWMIWSELVRNPGARIAVMQRVPYHVVVGREAGALITDEIAPARYGSRAPLVTFRVSASLVALLAS